MKLTVERTLEVCPELSQNPSIARTGDGDLLLLHTNTGDCMAGCMLSLRRSTDGGLTWSEPERTITSDLELGGVEGTLSCVDDLAFIMYAEGSDLKRRPHNPKRTRVMRSTDNGRNWSMPQPLETGGHAAAPYGRVIRLRREGQLLAPVYGFLTPLDGSGGRAPVVIMASDDEGQTWYPKGGIKQDPSVTDAQINETDMIELPDGRLLAVSRCDAAPGGFSFGLWSISRDGGASWTDAMPTNINLAEPRLTLDDSGNILLVTRTYPGNVYTYYRPLRPEEREPDSEQTETGVVGLRDEYLSAVREYGVVIFTTPDEGRTWEPVLTLENPRGPIQAPPEERQAPEAEAHFMIHYQACYGCLAPLGGNRYFAVFRQGDPSMPDLRPGLTYSHLYQRFLAGNIIAVVPD